MRVVVVGGRGFHALPAGKRDGLRGTFLVDEHVWRAVVLSRARELDPALQIETRGIETRGLP